MKNIFLPFLTLLLVTSCSTDDTILNTETNLELSVTQEEENSNLSTNTDQRFVSTSSGLKNEKSTNTTRSVFIDEDVNPDLGSGSFDLIGPAGICSNFHFTIGNVTNLGEYYLTVTYNPQYVSFFEIACVRQEYFLEFPYLKMAEEQNTNPYIDIWVDKDPCINYNPETLEIFICTPNGTNPTSPAKKGTDTDPRTSS